MQHGSIKVENNENILVLLSGPEPQRTILERLLTKQLLQSQVEATMVLGSGKPNHLEHNGKLKIISLATSAQTEELILNASMVICRPGYSTIMDLSAIGGKALFIPTPGQTEQEYLADYHMNKGTVLSVSQDDFDIKINLQDAFSYKGFLPMNPGRLLQQKFELTGMNS